MMGHISQRPSSPVSAPTAEFPILSRVSELEHFLFSYGPKTEVSSVCVDFQPTGPSDKFADLSAFQTPFNEDVACYKEMQAIVKESDHFIAMTYCYRSCSKALPMMKNETDDTMRKDIHQKTFAILRPEIAKLHEFAAFYERIIDVFVQNFKRLVQPATKGEVASDDHIRMLQIVLDRLIILDALKDMKACLQNDFARYKRSFSNIRADLPDSDAVADDIHNLQMFLGNPQHPNDLIVTRLRSEIQKIPGHEDVVVLLADDALRALQKRDYLLQDEKHILERVLINTIFLLDGESKRMSNAFKYKKFDIEGIRLYFKRRPFLPLFGDMHLNIKFVLKRCTNFDPAKMEGQWFTGDTQHYLLVEQKQMIESEFNAFKTSFLHVLSSIKSRAEGRDNAPVDQNLAREVFDQVLDGFKLLSKWSTAIKEQSAFKRANPIDQKTFLDKGGIEGPGFSFECVDRYNYSSEELTTLCAVISMLKTTGSILRDAEPLVMTIIRKSMHDDLQYFLQGTLSQPLRKAYKKGKDDVRTYMCLLRWIAADWSRESAIAQDYKSHSKDKSAAIDFPKRCVQPSYTQMLLLRRISLEIFSEKSKGMQGGIFTEKNITKDLVPEFERFYDRLFFYPYLLDYKATLSSCLDMSDLWYREFYLEITKCVQFPISMSLPFILAEHIVNTPQIADSLLQCIDVYNDAADRALNALNQQFIFREVEAELNLAFHTLVHTLSMNIFTCFKAISSVILLDHDHKHWQDLKTPIWKKFDPSASGFVILMQQRDIRLLGRSVDLRRLLAQHINGYFRQNIDMAIARFESCDLSTIIDLKSILEQTQLTHRLLSEHLCLDQFQSIVNDVNAMAKFPPFCGRIVVHIYSELLGDLIPNFCLNTSTQVFRRGPVSYTDPMPRDPPPSFMAQFWYTQNYNKQFADALKTTHDFFGPDHMLSLIHLLDTKDFVTLFEQIYIFMEEKVNYVFASYCKVLIDSMDPIKLPSLKYGVIGGFGYFDLKLKPIACYENLRSEFFQAIKEIGNTLAFVHQLSLAHCQYSTWDMNVLSYFQKLADAASEISHDHPQSPTDPLRHCVEQSLILRPAEESPALLTVTLERLYKSVQNSGALTEWIGKTSPNVLDLETPKDFCRLWSALQFIFLNLTQEQIDGVEPCNVEIFGDGFSWAGITFLHLCGFRSRFEALDFVYYILRMQLISPANLAIDPKKYKKGKGDPEKELFPFVKKLLEEGSNTKLLNSYIFSILESHFDGVYTFPVISLVPETDQASPSNHPRLSTQAVKSPSADSFLTQTYFSSTPKA